MDDNKGETLLGLVARRQERPDIRLLEPVLFPDGLGPRAVVELSGEPATGKTLLMMDFVKRLILPQSFNGLPLNGLNSGVILLNQDHQFSVPYLATMLRNYLSRKLGDVAEEDLSSLIESSLKKLIIIDIYDPETYSITCHLVKRILCDKSDISLILIDSISAFYWQSTMSGGIRRMDLYTQNTLKCLTNCIKDFGVNVIFSRPAYFQSKSQETELSDVLNLSSVNVSIRLKSRVRDQSLSYFAEIKTHSSFFIAYYSIDSSGFTWSK